MSNRAHYKPSVNAPIPADKKITYSFFVRSVWALSNTNLPAKDFEAEFGPQLEKMFAPVRVMLPVDGVRFI